MRFFAAIRAFFSVLFSAKAAQAVRLALSGAEPVSEAKPAEPAKPKQPPAPKRPTRNDAITLLATLQREARFVDFIQEPLAGYSDAQIGAAAREVHRDCGQVIARLFELKPVVAEAEGAAIEVPDGFDPGRFQLTGNVAGSPPYSGRVAHHGWEAAHCELPTWSGNESAAKVVAPAEISI